MKFILASLVACAVAQNCEADPDVLSALQQGSTLNKQVSSVDALQERAQSIADVIKDGALEAGTAGKRGKKDKDKDKDEVDKSCKKKRGKKKCLEAQKEAQKTTSTTTASTTTTSTEAPALVDGGEDKDAIFSLNAVSSLDQEEWAAFTAKLKSVAGLKDVDAPEKIKDLTADGWRKMVAAAAENEDLFTDFATLCEVALTLRNLRHLSKDEWEEVVTAAAALTPSVTLPAESLELSFEVFDKIPDEHEDFEVTLESALTLHALRKLSDDEWTKLHAKHDDLPKSSKIADFPLATLLARLKKAEDEERDDEFVDDSRAAISTNRILQLDKEGYAFLRSKMDDDLPENQDEFDIDALEKLDDKLIAKILEGEFDFDVAATGIAGRGDRLNLRGLPFAYEVNTDAGEIFGFTFADGTGYGYAS